MSQIITNSDPRNKSQSQLQFPSMHIHLQTHIHRNTHTYTQKIKCKLSFSIRKLRKGQEKNTFKCRKLKNQARNQYLLFFQACEILCFWHIYREQRHFVLCTLVNTLFTLFLREFQISRVFHEHPC